jgi:hypothetical protein
MLEVRTQHELEADPIKEYLKSVFDGAKQFS